MRSAQDLEMITERARELASPDSRGVAIFGSVARGDSIAESDIDVLQLVPQYRALQTVGQYRISSYEPFKLMEMARRGSLFVLHLKTDGIVLDDPEGLLKLALDSYRPLDSYSRLFDELRLAAKFLDVNEHEFDDSRAALVSSGIYILRTKLFGDCASAGTPIFSIPRLAERYQDPRIEVAYRIKYKTDPTYDEFLKIRDLLEEYLKVRIVNEFSSLDELLGFCKRHFFLAYSLGRKIMGMGPVQGYELWLDR